MILVALAIAVAALGVVACLRMWEQRQARRLVASLVSRPCPACGEVFGTGVLTTAQEVHTFFDPPPGTSIIDIGPIPRIAAVVCPQCSARWEYCENELLRISSVRRATLVILG